MADLSIDGAWWVTGFKSSGQLRPGVYCAPDGIKLSGFGVTGNVTLVTTGPNGSVDISGSGFTLTPYKKNVLVYSAKTGVDAIKIAGSGGSWKGYLYAPHGVLDFSGSGNLSFEGSIIAGSAKLQGSDWSLRAPTGAAVSRVQLME